MDLQNPTMRVLKLFTGRRSQKSVMVEGKAEGHKHFSCPKCKPVKNFNHQPSWFTHHQAVCTDQDQPPDLSTLFPDGDVLRPSKGTFNVQRLIQTTITQSKSFLICLLTYFKLDWVVGGGQTCDCSRSGAFFWKESRNAGKRLCFVEWLSPDCHPRTSSNLSKAEKLITVCFYKLIKMCTPPPPVLFPLLLSALVSSYSLICRSFLWPFLFRRRRSFLFKSSFVLHLWRLWFPYLCSRSLYFLLF